MASKGGDTKIVGVLLQRGADPNQCDDDVSDIIWPIQYKSTFTCTYICKGSAS